MIIVTSLRRTSTQTGYGTEVLYVEDGTPLVARFNYEIRSPQAAINEIERLRSMLDVRKCIS